MLTNIFLFSYSIISTLILTFLFSDWIKIKKWYLTILINPESNVRVVRFFKEMNSVLKQFYPMLDILINERGRKPVDFKFQFRFLIWWKFFNQNPLNQAIREFNSSMFLKKALKSPIDHYSREIFHTFRKKLDSSVLEEMQEKLISDFLNMKILNLKTIIFDSFPVKSVLNAQKCLKRPKFDENLCKKFISQLSLDPILRELEISSKMFNKLKTKLIALSVKELWDLPSWDKCWKVLYDSKNKTSKFSELHYYSTYHSLKGIAKELQKNGKGKLAEQLLLTEICRVLKNMNLNKKNWFPETLSDLNSFFYTPHRFKDPGISIYHCSSKNEHSFGRGGVVAVSKELEIPLFMNLTPKYKQSERSILEFLGSFYSKFKNRFTMSTILADSEFGSHELFKYMQDIKPWNVRIPSYGHSKTTIKCTKQERDDRKIVERVIGRMAKNWNLERPSHIGHSFANFHLQIAMLCDLLQVKFNSIIGNQAHPHAIKEIRG